METIKNYLTQKSTYLGIFKVLAAFTAFQLTPELQDQLAENLVHAGEGIVALIGTYLIIKDFRKKK